MDSAIKSGIYGRGQEQTTNASSNGSMRCSSDAVIITTRKGKKTTGSEQKE
jgi:hypothetical protein